MASSEPRQNGTTEASDFLEPRPTWLTGVIPGLAGGFVMALVLVVLSVAQRPGPLAPFSLIASLFGAKFGTSLTGVVVGLAIHTGMSAVLGSIFGRIAGDVPRRYLLGLGVLFSLNIWAAVQFIVLPLMNPDLASPAAVVWPFLLGHLAFGLMLAASIPVASELQGPALVRAAMLPPTVAARVVLETTERVKGAVETVAGELPATARALQNASDKVQEAVKDLVDSVLPDAPQPLPARKRV
jgi:hypothetical protein